MHLPQLHGHKLITDATLRNEYVPNSKLEELSVTAGGYDVILLVGQSNMSGRGSGHTSSTDPAHRMIFQYGSKNRTLRSATEPLDMHDTPSGIGPGLQFARRYVAEGLNQGRKVLLVPAAHGGTPLVSTATLGWRHGVAGNLTAQAVTQTQQALAAGGTGSRLVGILWVQGETDSDNSTTGTAYQADLDALIAGLRTDLGAADVPFVIGGMVPEYLGTGTRTAIDAVHKDTPNRVAYTGFGEGPKNANLGDGNHYNATGYRALARTMFEAFKRAANGLLPDTHVATAEPISGAAAAQVYSLRTVTSGYAGPLVKVSRSTDTELLDVYATGGELDQATLLSFAGSGAAYVHTWYDQSGNNRHITQATAAARPKLVDAGVVVTSGTKPAVQFDGMDDVLFNTTPALFAAGAASMAAVINAAVPGGQTRWWAESLSTASGDQYGLHQSDEPEAGFRGRARPVVSNAVSALDTAYRGAINTFDGTIKQVSATDSGAAFSQWVNGAADITDVAYTRPASTKNRFAIGGVVRNGSLAPLAMKLSEFVAWDQDISDNDRTTVQSSQKTFYGTA